MSLIHCEVCLACQKVTQYLRFQSRLGWGSMLLAFYKTFIVFIYVTHKLHRLGLDCIFTAKSNSDCCQVFEFSHITHGPSVFCFSCGCNLYDLTLPYKCWDIKNLGQCHKMNNLQFLRCTVAAKTDMHHNSVINIKEMLLQMEPLCVSIFTLRPRFYLKSYQSFSLLQSQQTKVTTYFIFYFCWKCSK